MNSKTVCQECTNVACPCNPCQSRSDDACSICEDGPIACIPSRLQTPDFAYEKWWCSVSEENRKLPPECLCPAAWNEARKHFTAEVVRLNGEVARLTGIVTAMEEGCHTCPHPKRAADLAGG